MSTAIRSCALLLMAGVVLVVGCGRRPPNAGGATVGGCGRDIDCQGNLVCERGACVAFH